MGAAILTVCSALTLTGCVEKDNSSSQPSGQYKYTTEQIKSTVVGMWLDETKITPDDTERLYEITDDGLCNLYDLVIGESNGETVEVEGMTTYSGTWSVTNETAKLDFVNKLNLDGFELMGALMLKTELQISESDNAMKQIAASGLLPNLEMKDTLAVLRNADGEVMFLNRYDANLFAMLVETGQLSSEEAAARAATRAMTEEDIQRKISAIKSLKQLNDIFVGKNAAFVNHEYMFFDFGLINPRVCDMSILGAAAVPSYYVKETKEPNSMPVGLKRQYLSVTQLWNLGVRFFDLGCFYKPGQEDTYGFYDPDADYRYTDVTPIDIFKELKGLLESNPREVAILKFSAAPNTDEGHLKMNVLQLNDELENVFGNRLLKQYGPDLRLNDCEGKVIVMNSFPYEVGIMAMGLQLGSIWKDDSPSEDLYFPNGEKGTVSVYLSKKVVNKDDADINIHNVKGHIDFANESAMFIKPAWVITNLSSYVSNSGQRYYSMMANIMNEAVAKELLSKKYAKTGIVIVDFIGKNSRVNEPLGFAPKGADIIVPIIGTNYYAATNHLISFDKGDMPK